MYKTMLDTSYLYKNTHRIYDMLIFEYYISCESALCVYNMHVVYYVKRDFHCERIICKVCLHFCNPLGPRFYR